MKRKFFITVDVEGTVDPFKVINFVEDELAGPVEDEYGTRTRFFSSWEHGNFRIVSVDLEKVEPM